MTVPPVVSNSSPLIALDHIGQLALLGKLFSAVIVPPAVVAETVPRLSLPAWIEQRGLDQSVGVRILQASLGPGESEAISLALEVGAKWILLDDRPARRQAQALGLPVIGTLGILLASKRRGFLPLLRPSVDLLMETGFRLSPSLYAQVLGDAGEHGR